MENGPFIDDFPIKTAIYEEFSMAMLNNQMVNPPILLNFFSPQKTLNSTGFLGTAHAHVNNLLHDVIYCNWPTIFFLHRTGVG